MLQHVVGLLNCADPTSPFALRIERTQAAALKECLKINMAIPPTFKMKTNKGRRKVVKAALLFAASIVFSFLCSRMTVRLFGGAELSGGKALLGNLAFHLVLLAIGRYVASHPPTGKRANRMGYMEARAWFSGLLLIPGALIVTAVIVVTRSAELYPIAASIAGLAMVCVAYRHMQHVLETDEEVIAYLQSERSGK